MLASDAWQNQSTLANSYRAETGAMTPRLLLRRVIERVQASGIAGRFVIATVAVGAAMASTISLYTYTSGVSTLTGNARLQLAASVDTAVSRVSARIDAGVQDIKMLAKMPPVLDLAEAQPGDADFAGRADERDLRDRLARIFTAFLEARPGYFQARLIGAADGGREIVRVERTSTGQIARTPESALQAKADRPYFSETVRLPAGQVHISDLDLSRENGRVEDPPRPALRFATPIVGSSRRIYGIVVLNMEASRLFSLVDDAMGPDHVNLVTNATGDYLAGPDPDRTFGFDLGKRYQLQTDVPALAPIVTGERDSLTGDAELGDEPYLAHASRIRFDAAHLDRYLVVASLLSRHTLLADTRSQRNTIVMIGIALVTVGAVFAALLSRAVVRPLNRLAAAANEIAAGSRDISLGALADRQDETGHLARSLAVMVGEIAVREERLVAQTRELVRSNQELAQFAYIASHDLQEPLRMVGSYMELLTRRYADRLDGEALEFIGFAVDGAARMKRLINDLLGYSRAGNNPLRLESVRIGDLVHAVLRTLAQQIEDNGATVEVGGLPRLTVDAVQIERLLINLVENALKYRSKEPPRILISAACVDGAWRFSVADNGIGIDPRFKDKVFEIFKRLHGRDEYSGTGIGLAVAKLVVERHGGHIGVEPNPGGGSVFTFTLPA